MNLDLDIASGVLSDWTSVARRWATLLEPETISYHEYVERLTAGLLE